MGLGNIVPKAWEVTRDQRLEGDPCFPNVYPPYQGPWKLFFMYLYRHHDLDFVDERDHEANVCV